MRLVISKKGYPITDTDPTHKIFDSSFKTLKTVPGFLNTFQQVVNASASTTVSFAHGLTIRPLVLAYYRDTADNKYRIVMSDPSNGAVNRYSSNINVSVAVDATNIYFTIRNGNGVQKTVEVFYEHFYEGA